MKVGVARNHDPAVGREAGPGILRHDSADKASQLFGLRFWLPRIEPGIEEKLAAGSNHGEAMQSVVWGGFPGATRPFPFITKKVIALKFVRIGEGIPSELESPRLMSPFWRCATGSKEHRRQYQCPGEDTDVPPQPTSPRAGFRQSEHTPRGKPGDRSVTAKAFIERKRHTACLPTYS